MAAIELSGIAHQYNPLDDPGYALQNVNEHWHDGGAYALLGPSGCGKTTLLNIISGLIHPSQGRVLFDGVDVTDLTPEQRNIAQIFQFPVVYDTLTVAENLAFPLRNRRLPVEQIRQRVDEVLQMLNLQHRAKQKAHSLSADDKQKISLGRGLVRTDVKAILFDEPLTVIDPHLKWQLRTELKRIHQQFQHTMIYVTHDQTEALTFADKVIVMYEGSVVQIGTPQELFEKPAHTFVGRFIGSPGMNVIKAEVYGSMARIGDHEIVLADHYDSAIQQVELGIRPEYITISGTEGMPVEIISIEDIGKHMVLKVHVQGCFIDVIAHPGTEIPSEPRLLFDADKFNVYKNSILIEPGEF